MSRKKILGKMAPTLTVTRIEGSIPLTGWQDPMAQFTLGGQRWEVAIAGGCQSVWIRKVGSTVWHAVEIGELAPAIVRFIEECRAA